jgi:hypothetical protein
MPPIRIAKEQVARLQPEADAEIVLILTLFLIRSALSL